LISNTAKLLSEGKIIGWFQGRMEFGPRALGDRSILSSPNPRAMKEKVNIIKIREQFRPFAGSILQEKVHEYFKVPEKNHWSPFMIFCFKVKKEKRKDLAAIVHKDNTCRIQTVNKEDNGRYYKLIKEFYRLTDIPCVLNTSFNLKGEPIVENPKQAIEDFLKTRMDYLIIGDYLVSKVSGRG
jgi:carbamoyltransferase